jgi:hypothetical protein
MHKPLEKYSDLIDNSIREITYLSYLRQDFVDRVLKLNISSSNKIDTLYFSSNSYGTCYWENGRGIIDVHRWENEDNVQSMSKLSKHYTSLLLDGEMPDEYGLIIIDDVLIALDNDKIKELVNSIIVRKHFDEQLKDLSIFQ